MPQTSARTPAVLLTPQDALAKPINAAHMPISVRNPIGVIPVIPCI